MDPWLSEKVRQTLQIIAGWWFGTFLICPDIGNVIAPTPTDEVIFFRGVGQPPTRVKNYNEMQESTSYKDLVSNMELNFTLKQIFFVLKM